MIDNSVVTYMPTVFVYQSKPDEPVRRYLIRGMDTPFLCALLVKIHSRRMYEAALTRHTPNIVRALSREVKRREGVNGFILHIAQKFDPDPCACGKAGTHLVGPITYCGECVRTSSRVLRIRQWQQHNKTQKDRHFEEIQKAIDTTDAASRRMRATAKFGKKAAFK